MKIDVNISKHAFNRLKERAVRISQIEETIRKPDYALTYGDVREATRSFNEKDLKVRYLSEGEKVKILTVRWKK